MLIIIEQSLQKLIIAPLTYGLDGLNSPWPIGVGIIA